MDYDFACSMAAGWSGAAGTAELPVLLPPETFISAGTSSGGSACRARPAMISIIIIIIVIIIVFIIIISSNNTNNDNDNSITSRDIYLCWGRASGWASDRYVQYKDFTNLSHRHLWSSSVDGIDEV